MISSAKLSGWTSNLLQIDKYSLKKFEIENPQFEIFLYLADGFADNTTHTGSYRTARAWLFNGKE
jgi:hypothetical protein